MLTRREFISTGLKGLGFLAVSGYAPAFLTRTALAAGAAKDANILVVIQLSGGNDGLNTVIPYADDLYYKARPQIGLRKSQLLALDGHLGLHPELKPLKAAFDQGQFAIVNNVGYPNPNRSHFRSMEIWHTGESDENRSEPSGWLGRYCDAQCAGADPRRRAELGDIGMSFGKVMPQALRNRANVGLALDDPDTFRWNASGETVALAKAQEAIFAKLNNPAGLPVSAMDRLAGLGAVSGSEPETLDFLKHTAMNAVVAGDRIRAILGKQGGSAAYPNSWLGQQLKMVAKLIANDFPTRVYYASQGGFDTHAGQLGSHARLMADLAQTASAFHADLRATRHSERVLVMAFSEFGRRVAENGSAGTDHGAAAPMFLLGDAVKGGLHGAAPDLANLLDGDLRHQIDFRQVYASILDRWLATPSKGILGRDFQTVAVL